MADFATLGLDDWERQRQANIAATEALLNTKFENGGDKPLQVPGFGLKIDVALPKIGRFAHGVSDWGQRPRLTAREISMLGLMNAITEKPNSLSPGPPHATSCCRASKRS